MMTAIAASLLQAAAPAAGDRIELDLPVDCGIGKECFIQNYFDHDPGEGWADYRCGGLSYDDHKGTDFRAATLQQMEEGVPIVAAADGVVIGVRDGEPDISVRERGFDAVEGREAGNGVNIRHGDGWTTQYSHMKEGSVRVKVGDRVEAGDVLGEIGLSGFTEFPHVHFAVRHEGERLDPFVGQEPGFACGEDRDPLWSDEALQALQYQPTAVLNSGFAATRPNADQARKGVYDGRAIGPDRPLVFWVDAFGVQAGDEQHVRLVGPDGVIVDNRRPLEEDKAAWFAFAGKRPPTGGWPPGDYEATYRILRDGRVVAETEDRVTIE